MRSTRPLTENERRVLTLIAEAGPLARRVIARRGRMAWATTVKIVGRLEEQGFIRMAGVQPQPSRHGPDAALYDLVAGFPLAVGIDIEYSRTTAALVDLRGQIHARIKQANPRFDSSSHVADYCVGVREALFAQLPEARETTVGTGVGMPFHLVKRQKNIFATVRRILVERIGGLVEADDVARAYALKVQHAHRDASTFAVVTIRTGVGLGLAVNGRLLRGTSDHSGLIAHAVVRPGNGKICLDCGHEGCLATVVSQRFLCAAKLSRAAAGDKDACRDIQSRIDALAQATSQAILIMNPERVYVAGHFGEYEGFFGSLLCDALKRYVPSFIPYSLRMEELSDDWFPAGAAFLVLANYCNYEVVR